MKESTAWMWHILAAAILLFLLGLHMGVMHLPDVRSMVGPAMSTHEYLEYTQVAQRVKSIGFFIFYTLFLAFALYHGLYGLRGIILELVPSKEKIVTYSLLILGIILFSLGTYARIVVFTM